MPVNPHPSRPQHPLDSHDPQSSRSSQGKNSNSLPSASTSKSSSAPQSRSTARQPGAATAAANATMNTQAWREPGRSTTAGPATAPPRSNSPLPWITGPQFAHPRNNTIPSTGSPLARQPYTQPHNAPSPFARLANSAPHTTPSPFATAPNNTPPSTLPPYLTPPNSIVPGPRPQRTELDPRFSVYEQNTQNRRRQLEADAAAQEASGPFRWAAPVRHPATSPPAARPSSSRANAVMAEAAGGGYKSAHNNFMQRWREAAFGRKAQAQPQTRPQTQSTAEPTAEPMEIDDGPRRHDDDQHQHDWRPARTSYQDQDPMDIDAPPLHMQPDRWPEGPKAAPAVAEPWGVAQNHTSLALLVVNELARLWDVCQQSAWERGVVVPDEFRAETRVEVMNLGQHIEGVERRFVGW